MVYCHWCLSFVRVSSSVTFDSEATVSRFTSEWFNQNKHIIDVMRTETMTVNLASLPMNKCENTPLIQNNFAGTQAWYLKTGSRGSEIVTFRVPTVIVTRMYFQLLSNTTTGSLFCFVLNNNQVSVRFPVQDHSTNTQNIQQSSLHNDSISNVCCTLRSTYVAVVSIVLLLFVVQSN